MESEVVVFESGPMQGCAAIFCWSVDLEAALFDKVVNDCTGLVPLGGAVEAVEVFVVRQAHVGTVGLKKLNHGEVAVVSGKEECSEGLFIFRQKIYPSFHAQSLGR